MAPRRERVALAVAWTRRDVMHCRAVMTLQFPGYIWRWQYQRIYDGTVSHHVLERFGRKHISTCFTQGFPQSMVNNVPKRGRREPVSLALCTI